MSEDTQRHLTRNGDAVFVVTRNGKHQYRYYKEYLDQSIRGRTKDSMWLPSVTTIASYIGGDSFSIGMNWALKKVREAGGDMDAPKRNGTQARDVGNKLHQDIDNFIKNPDAPQAEDNDLFMLWHRELGSHKWVASEQFLVNTSYGYGGTADAISLEPDGFAIWDWKTKDSGYTIRPSELAQITAYALAMESMDHPLTPVKAFIACVMRDGSGIDITPVDISPVGHNAKLFFIGQDMYHALRNAKGGKE